MTTLTLHQKVGYYQLYTKKFPACIIVVAFFRMTQVLLQTIFIFFARRMLANQIRDNVKKPGREIVTFLLMVNLAMFLINTFETQKSGSNPLTIEFYGKSVWTVIVYSTVPLNTFFRYGLLFKMTFIHKV